MPHSPRQVPDASDALRMALDEVLRDADVINEIETLIERFPLDHHSCLRDGLRLLEQSGSRGLVMSDWIAILKLDRGWGAQAGWCVRTLIETFGCCVTHKGQTVYIYTPCPSPSLDAFDLDGFDQEDDGSTQTTLLLRALEAMGARTTFSRDDVTAWLREDGAGVEDQDEIADRLIHVFARGQTGGRFRVEAKSSSTIADTMADFRAMLHPGR